MVRATAANAQIRAFACTTRETVETARAAHNTSPVVTAALGRLLSAGVMMGSMLKGDDELITLQIKGDGPIGGLTVTADRNGHVKAHKYVSELLGKETIDTNTYGKSSGRSGNYSTNYQISGRELMTPDEVRMLDNRYALLFVRGERPVMDFKYDILKHPNVKLTADGGQPPYIHGEPTQAVATLVFDSDIPDNAVSVKAVSTSYELLSDEDLEEIFNL